MFFPLVNALIVDVRRVVVAGTDRCQLSPHDAECRAEPWACRVKPCFAASPMHTGTGWQSGRNIAAPSKYINRQGKHLPDPTAERARGVRHVQIGEAAGQRIDN